MDKIKMRNIVQWILACGLLLAACGPIIPAPPVPPDGLEPPTFTPPVEASAAPVATTTPVARPTKLSPTAPPTAAPSPTDTLAPTPVAFSLPERPLWGIHVHNFDRAQDLDLAVQSGAYWTRFDQFNWDKLQPNPPPDRDYRWEALDEAGLAAAVAGGLNPIGIVLFAPDWAQAYPGAACGPIATEALDEFALFIEALVTRYSQPPYNIQYWEIGNEPEVARQYVDGRSGFGCWGEPEADYYGGAVYAEMLKRVYPALKRANPQAKLVMGGLIMSCDPVNPPEKQPGSGELQDCSITRFFEGVLAAGGGDFFDAVSFHAYDYYIGVLGQYGNSNWHSSYSLTGPVLIAKARYLRAVLAAHGLTGKELLNTEVALICGRTGQEPECQTEEFELTKAYYAAQANAAAYAQGLGANIWYSLNGWRASGLIGAGSQPTLALQAFHYSTQTLAEVAPAGEMRDFPGLMGYRFQNETREIWLVWSQDGAEHEMALPDSARALRNVFGEELELPISDNPGVIVAAEPVYVELQR